MITVQTYLFNEGRKTGYKGYGSMACPHCGFDSDIGTGEHSLPQWLVKNRQNSRRYSNA